MPERTLPKVPRTPVPRPRRDLSQQGCAIRLIQLWRPRNLGHFLSKRVTPEGKREVVFSYTLPPSPRSPFPLRRAPRRLLSVTMQLRKAARVILIGAPGVGKGTQSERLLQRFPQLSSISSGDLLRHNVKQRTPLGECAIGVHCQAPNTDHFSSCL